MPWCQTNKIPITAYTPLEQGRLLRNTDLNRVAARHGSTSVQVALAWVLRKDGAIAIPQTGNPEHVRENRLALEIELTQQDLSDLDRAFPPPNKRRALEML